MPAKKKSTIIKFSSLNHLRTRCLAGETDAQLVCIAALTNLGCEHLAEERAKDMPKWLRYWHGYNAYLMSMVGEYGMDEGQAEKDLLDEINAARSYCHVEEKGYED